MQGGVEREEKRESKENIKRGESRKSITGAENTSKDVIWTTKKIRKDEREKKEMMKRWSTYTAWMCGLGTVWTGDRVDFPTTITTTTATNTTTKTSD